MTECYFTPKKDTTSATICANCGQEKSLHTIGEGIKVKQTIIQTDVHKYRVDEPRKLKSWEAIARHEIKRWLTDENYEKEVTENTAGSQSEQIENSRRRRKLPEQIIEYCQKNNKKHPDTQQKYRQDKRYLER